MHHTHIQRIKGLRQDMPIEEVYKITREQLQKMAEQTDQLELFLKDLEEEQVSDEDYFTPSGDSDGECSRYL